MTREEAKENLKWLLECSYVDSFEDAENEALRMAIVALEEESKIGHWILDETDNSITCDKCGCLIWANDISNGEAYYCPNCGADMRGDTE